MVEDDPDVRMPDTGCLSKPNIVYISTIVETIKIGLPVYIGPMTWPNGNMTDRSSLGRWNRREQKERQPPTTCSHAPCPRVSGWEPDVPPLPEPFRGPVKPGTRKRRDGRRTRGGTGPTPAGPAPPKLHLWPPPPTGRAASPDGRPPLRDTVIGVLHECLHIVRNHVGPYGRTHARRLPPSRRRPVAVRENRLGERARLPGRIRFPVRLPPVGGPAPARAAEGHPRHFRPLGDACAHRA